METLNAKNASCSLKLRIDEVDFFAIVKSACCITNRPSDSHCCRRAVYRNWDLFFSCPSPKTIKQNCHMKQRATHGVQRRGRHTVSKTTSQTIHASSMMTKKAGDGRPGNEHLRQQPASLFYAYLQIYTNSSNVILYAYLPLGVSIAKSGVPRQGKQLGGRRHVPFRCR